MEYLLGFEIHLKGYANLIELKEKYPSPSDSDKDSFIAHIKYFNAVQEIAEVFVKEDVKLV